MVSAVKQTPLFDPKVIYTFKGNNTEDDRAMMWVTYPNL